MAACEGAWDGGRGTICVTVAAEGTGLLVDAFMAAGVAGICGAWIIVVAIRQHCAATLSGRAVLASGSDAVGRSAVVLRNLRRFTHGCVLAATCNGGVLAEM